MSPPDSPFTGDEPIEFRHAREADWPGIWQVFREVVAGGDTYPYPPDIEEPDARAAWMTHGPKAATYVASEGRAIVGTAYVRPNQPGLGDHVANAGWMLSTSVRGRGIGRRFADHVIGEARELGFTAMQFNAVVATNTTAISLWESLGFTVVGTVPEAFRHIAEGPVSVHVMYRTL